jgi:multiple sugar transport system permease protein
MLKPSLLVALLFRTVDGLRVFDLAKIMTNGSFGTETLSVLTQRFIVEIQNPGVGATLSTITFVIVLGVGMVFSSRLARDVVTAVE